MEISKVFITGSNGQLGRELKAQLDERGFASAGYDIPELDISDMASAEALVEKEAPDVIINCGALTNVDGCEDQIDLANKVNGEGPRVMAKIAAKHGIPIVQVSTDYVFDGNGIKDENGNLRPYVEQDTPAPKSVYGSSKLAGERAVAEETDQYYVVRTAWLYGDGNNFVKTMLRLAKTHPKLTVVADQVGSPTSTKDLARAILDLMTTEAYGIYHGTCEGQCSWYDFAKAIFDKTGTQIDVSPVSSEEYGSPANRPAYSVLENKGLNDLGINSFRPWEDALDDYLSTLDREAL